MLKNAHRCLEGAKTLMQLEKPSPKRGNDFGLEKCVNEIKVYKIHLAARLQ